MRWGSEKFMVALFRIYVVVKVAAAHDKPSSNSEIETVLELHLRLFENCTLYVASRGQNLYNFEERDERDLAYNVCNKIFRNKFCVIAHSSLFSNNSELKSTPKWDSEDWYLDHHYTPYMKTFNKSKLHDTCTTLLVLPSVIKNSIIRSDEILELDILEIADTVLEYAAISFPEYMLCVVAQRNEEEIQNKMYVTLPRIIASTKVFGVLMSDISQIYMACFTCPKSLDRVGKYRKMYWWKIWSTRIFIFQRVDSIGTLFSLEDAWTSVNLQKWNCFGVSSETKDVKSVTRPCESSMVDSDGCLMLYILEQRNCSLCSKHVYIYDHKPIWEYERHKHVYILTSTARWSEAKYILVLGEAEDSRRIPMNLIKFFSPFRWEVWMILSVTIFCINAIMTSQGPCSAKSLHNWTFWILSVLFEQDCIKRTTTLRNMSIISAWLFTTLVLRSMYCFSMYSDLTSPATPDNLPLTKYDLVNESKSATKMFFWSENSMKTFRYNVRDLDLEGLKIAEFYRKIFSFVFEVSSEKSFNGDKSLSENVLFAKPFPCLQIVISPEGFVGKDKHYSSCSTSGRVAVIDSAVDWYLQWISGPFLSIFSDRLIYRPLNEQVLTSTMQFQSSIEKNFYFRQLNLLFSVLKQSGILSLINERSNLNVHMKRVSSFSTRLQLNLTDAVMSQFVTEYMETLSKSILIKGKGLMNPNKRLQFDENESRATFQEFRLIFVLHFALSFASVIAIVFEIMQRNKIILAVAVAKIYVIFCTTQAYIGYGLQEAIKYLSRLQNNLFFFKISNKRFSLRFRKASRECSH